MQFNTPDPQRLLKPSHRVPAFSGIEAIGAASWVSAVGDVVEYLGILVKRRVHEAEGPFANLDALLDNAVQKRRKNWRRHARAATDAKASVDPARVIPPVGRHVGNAVTIPIV
ncbi:hypothetical protein O1611_g7710 [Lasiodiplodia mahajangana]|uniref:Uncharacterized protein n=1 Tax=Lasiodiplodia mahajangana TaxID=1108764 RepID=A0ACC2JEH0_9PEZI|nr:hypothetical protein O1611_g7710 [Lasiodiplodia mahajangana]